MAEAYIYDAVRTPRGKGKANGSLHEQTSLQLATQVLQAIRDRNNLDTSKVDDVYMGCLSPIGEQGGNLPRIAVLNAGYSETVAGVQVEPQNYTADYKAKGRSPMFVDTVDYHRSRP
jgi:acetyl-CoA C-acetyltransferase